MLLFVSKNIEMLRTSMSVYQLYPHNVIVLLHKALQEELNMGRMWRGGYRRFHPIGDRMGNEMVDVFDVGRSICDLDMEYGIFDTPRS